MPESQNSKWHHSLERRFLQWFLVWIKNVDRKEGGFLWSRMLVSSIASFAKKPFMSSRMAVPICTVSFYYYYRAQCLSWGRRSSFRRLLDMPQSVYANRQAIESGLGNKLHLQTPWFHFNCLYWTIRIVKLCPYYHHRVSLCERLTQGATPSSLHGEQFHNNAYQVGNVDVVHDIGSIKIGLRSSTDIRIKTC